MVEIEKAAGQSLFDQAAWVIKETGEYKKEFTSQEVKDIMSGFVANVVQNQGAENVWVSKMEVVIEKNKGNIKGIIEVKKPAKVTIGIDCTMDNEKNIDKIKLVNLDIKTNAGIGTSLLIMATNVVGKSKESLKDPNNAFKQFLDSQLNPKGVDLTKLGLHFNENTLAVSLSGKTIAPMK